MYPYYIIREIFPEVKEIRFTVVDTNAWEYDRNKSFVYIPETVSNFHIKCPYECEGGETGIWYYGIISQMVTKRVTHRQERFNCNGYERSKKRFSCEWFAVLDIEITYLQEDEIR